MDFHRMVMQGLGNLSENDIATTLQNVLHEQNLIYSQPQLDLVETDTECILYIDVPGIEKDSIDVDFYNSKMEITGDRVKPYETQAKKNEVVYGKIHRKITLPISVTSSQSVTSSCKNGVLTIRISKANEEKNRFTIKVNSEEE